MASLNNTEHLSNNFVKSRMWNVIISLISVAMLLIVAFYLRSSFLREQRSDFEMSSQALKAQLQNELNQVISFASTNARLLSVSPSLHQVIRQESDTGILQTEWINTFNVFSSVSQIRVLNLQGYEVLRMHRGEGGIEWVTEENLQFKGDRDYFTQSRSMDSRLFVSALDLNKEQGVIERPLRPTIRSVAQIFIDGDIKGLLVVNFDLSARFEDLDAAQQSLAHWIINEAGYFISSPDNDEWGWLLNKPDATMNSLVDYDAEKLGLEEIHWIDERYLIQQIRLEHDASQVKLEQSRFYIVTRVNDTLLQDQAFNLQLIVITSSIFLIFIFIGSFSLDRRVLQSLRSERKAIQSEHSKALFLAQMSHEIRTPMNGLYGLLQVAMQAENISKIKENIQRSLYSFTSLKRIIDDILDFSKIEQGQLELSKQEFDLEDTMREVSEMMVRSALTKNIDMWIDIAPDTPKYFFGDAGRLNQVLMNLVGNAIKFTETGEIILSLQVESIDKGEVLFHFVLSDTGIGIKNTDNVFTAFKQDDQDIHLKYGGTGLGLSIVKQLIELMEGNITVESELHKGTRFTFNVKMSASKRPELYHSPPQNVNTLSTQVTIISSLVTASTILQNLCTALNWRVNVYSSISAFSHETITDSEKVHLIMVDELAITKESDITILNDVANKDAARKLVLVEQASQSRKRYFTSEIFDLVIYKPVTSSSLFDQVNSLVYERRSDDESMNEQVSSDKRLKGLRLLLVEDNLINQEVATIMLEQYGASVVIAENGLEAINELKKHDAKYSLVLMDMHMPVMDGLEATREIRKLEEFNDLPIIALTAFAMEEERQSFIDAGMQAHLAKPFEQQDLINIVSQYAIR